MAYEDHDQHSQRIFRANDYTKFDITEEDVYRSRRAYFANISYIDDKVGELMEALRNCRMEDDTIIVFCSDHGDMLGERGLWFKMSFLEGSARVPLMISSPDMKPQTIEAPVSLLDVTPTLADLAGADLSEVAPWTDGESLLPLTEGVKRKSPVLMEYAAEGSNAPLVAIRDARWKIIHCELDPPQLFDMVNDPHELTNLADDPDHAEIFEELMDQVKARWDMQAFDSAVRESQARRWVVL